MDYGFMGKLLKVDLTNQKIEEEVLNEDVLKQYIGGVGLGAKILYDLTDADTNPLGSENVLIFMTGPLAGTNALSSGRYEVITKSPLTNIFAQSNSGGTWGPYLKRAGYDGIVVEGKAKKPVYLWINEGKAQIRSAKHLWGKETFDTDSAIKSETNEKAVTACIGPAGESLVKMAAIINDGTDARAAARCGVGAVMGSKNLKAIAVFGTKRPKIYDEDALKQSVKKYAASIKSNAGFFGEFGTAGVIVPGEAEGDLPIKNWKNGSFVEGAKKINGDVMLDTIVVKNYSCYKCTIGCGKTIHVKEGKYKTVESGAPEYETLGILGANCLVDNLEAVAKGNEICNRFGLDTISAGSAVAFAMELFEHGLITKEDTGGIELNWGDGMAMNKMLEKIGRQEDIGRLLGEGVKRAAEKIGGIAKEFAVEAKGLEFPAHDPRCKFSMALSYAVSERGACHLTAFTYPFESGLTVGDMGYPETLERFTSEGKGEFVSKMQDLMSVLDSLSTCKFMLIGLPDITTIVLTEWLNAVTGWSMSPKELLKCGERMVNLKRMYNVRCGLSRKDDVLPPRLLSHAKPDGDTAGQLANFGKMLNDYYAYRGWSEIGIPTPETLKKLGIMEQ